MHIPPVGGGFKMKLNLRHTFPKLILVIVLFSGIISQTALITVSGQEPYVPRHRLTIQINNSAGGTTSPGPGSQLIDHGLSVQITAQANTGYVFNGWYLNGQFQHQLSSITVTMLGDNVVLASFSQQTASLTITVNPAEGGTTNPPAGNLSFPVASYVQVTAKANPGYVFNGWYLDGAFQGTDTVISLTMSGNKQLQAYFGTTAPTPTAVPTPTAEPGETSTPTPPPTPTPVPLPQAEMNVSVKSSVTYSGFAAEITGTLSGEGVGLAGEGVLLYLSVSGGTSWDILSYVNTNANGEFTVVWRPSVTGNYLLNATWLGNLDYSPTSTIVNFALAPYAEESVFSVTSNSTLSGLIFDSASSLLSFNVTGPSGTAGYVNAVIPKTLLNQLSSLKVYFDGSESTFDSVSQTDSWVVTFTYQHSSHEVYINLNAETTEQGQPIGEILRNLLPYIVPTTIIVVVIVIAALLVTKRKKKKSLDS